MMERKVIKDSSGRTIGYVQPEGYDEAATVLGVLLTLFLGFGILYLLVTLVASIWNAGKLARILLVGGVLTLLAMGIAGERPDLGLQMMELGRQYVASASAVPLTPYPNTNLLVVSVAAVVAIYGLVWLLWAPIMALMRLLVTTLFAMVAMTLVWAVWLAIGQALAAGIRIAGAWLTSGAIGTQLDWLQVSPVCFLLALPIVLRRDGGYRHLRRKGALFEALVLVAMICLSPQAGLWLLSRVGLPQGVDVAAGLGAMTNHVVGVTPLMPEGALELSVLTVLAGPLAGLGVAAYSTLKRGLARG
ncbi:MAG: hypothetical protein ACH37Z_10445 [Anaerolineae bacterium]